MSIYNDLCDLCGGYVDPIGGDAAVTGGAVGLDPDLLFCSHKHADDYDDAPLDPAEDDACLYCGASEWERHEPGCYLYEDDAELS